jgi:acyl carrier protein
MPISIESILPLSPQQKGMFFDSLQSNESGLHIEQHVFELAASVDHQLYCRAWERLVARHPALRAAFVWKNASEPVQAILSGVDVPIQFCDLRGAPDAEQRKQVDAFLESDRRRAFDLTKPPLMRLTIFQPNEETRLAVWTHHHIVLDGWSMPIVNRELTAIYETLRGDGENVPPGPAYREYLAWLARQNLDNAEAFWRAMLKGVEVPTSLGRQTGDPPPATHDSRSASHEVVLADSWQHRLRQTALRHRLTLNTLIQGAWALLLRRYSGRHEIVFGMTVSGRPPDLSGIESMIGLFINTLPIPVIVPDNAPVATWLHDLQRRHVELRQYEYCSSGQIHQWSGMHGSLPLYESVLVFENYPFSAPHRSLPSAPWSRSQPRFFGARTRYPLTIVITTDPEFTVRLVYATDRFPAESIAKIAQQLLVMLQSLAADEVRSTGELLTLVPADQIPQVYRRGARAERTIAPRTETERLIAKMWCELLGVGSVGVTESFFELGGHSLLATQLVSRVREKFQLDLPLRRFFDAPSVAGMATLIEDLMVEELARLDEADARRLVEAPLPGSARSLSHSQDIP